MTPDRLAPWSRAVLLALAGAAAACGGPSAPHTDDTDLVADTDDTDDTDVDTDVPAPAPTVTLLAPTAGATLFLDTRYDVVVTTRDADTATATVTGAPATCAPLNANVVHCQFVAHTPGTVTVDVRASGHGGTTTTSVTATARAAVGVIPDGERFAVGMYEVMDEAWFAPLSGSGVGIAQTYATGAYTQEAWQDWAVAAGLGTMTRPSWSWSDPWGQISDDDTLATLADREELVWWELPENVVDDASWADETADVVDRIRAHDDRPTQMYFWTSTPTEDLVAYVPFVDVLSPGTYPEHACQPQPWILWRIASARSAVAAAGYSDAERPIVGTADLYGRPEASCPDLAAELPQVRMNPLAMIAAGAHGVLYFAWYYAVYTLEPAWGALALETADLISGESGLGFAVLHGSARRDLPVTVTTGPAESAPFTPAHSATVVQYPSIHAAAWDYAGTRFVVAVNYTDQDVTAELRGLPSITPGVEVVGEGRTEVAVAGRLTDDFAPWGAHVYRAPIVAP